MSNRGSELWLVRHGQSEWNRAGRFTGWTDVGLTEQGVAEARQVGRVLAEAGAAIDVVHTSWLERAIHTAEVALAEIGRSWVDVRKSWRLNERHYGALQGLDKAETIEREGAEQVHRWRRSFRTRPPAVGPEDPRHPRHDPRYARLAPELLPGTESLADVLERLLPYWHDAIVPDLRDGRKVLVAAHGNSLRGLMMHLLGLGEDAIETFEIPVAAPIHCTLDPDLRATEWHYLPLE